MNKVEAYKNLRAQILSCKECGLCSEGVVGDFKANVAGEGNLDSRVIFVAQNPGNEEIKNSQPLTKTGKSGKVYEKTLNYLGLDRVGVYTTNRVACHSPDNREPEPWEIKKCEKHLRQQLELIQPKLIVSFGRFAAQAFIDNFKITRDHGKIYKSEEFSADIFPLYHPAYTFCYASLKQREEFKRDLKYLKSIINNYK